MVGANISGASRPHSCIGTELPAPVDPDSCQHIGQAPQLGVFLGVSALRQNGLRRVDELPAELSLRGSTLNAQHGTAILVPEVEKRLWVARGDLGILQPLVEHDESVSLHPEYEPVPYRWIALGLSDHTPGENQLEAGGPRGIAAVGCRFGPLAAGAPLPKPVSYRASLPDRLGKVPGDRSQDRHGFNEVGLAGRVRPDQDIQAFSGNSATSGPNERKPLKAMAFTRGFRGSAIGSPLRVQWESK